MRTDAHRHFRDPACGDYGWLTPAAGALYRSFEPAALAPSIAVGAYRDWHAVAAALIPSHDHDAISGDNARRLYRLESRS